MTLSQLDLIPGSGDQLLTLDSETDLEWLNLTATANKSYFQVIAGFGGFIGTHGFAYGTAGQVSTLFNHAGITRQFNDPPSTDMVNFLGMQTLAHFMNGWVFATGTSHSTVEVRGIIKPSAAPPESNASLDVFFTHLDLITPAHSYTESLPLIKAGQALPEVGSFLVRLHA